MTGIVKMVSKCFELAFCKTLQKHAHPTFVTLQMLGVKHLLWSNSVLKIRVSLVRFQSRPPIRTAVLRCRTAVFLILGPATVSLAQVPLKLSRRHCRGAVNPARMSLF